MFLSESRGSICFRLETGSAQGILKSIEAKWKELGPGQPFSPRFMDEAFDGMYRAERRMGKVLGAFALLAIFVACLGLFGLAMFSAEQRIREIGIRKVLGASVGNIVTLMSKDFLRLVLIAVLIALPLAWWVMKRWLEDFVYRITLSWWMFAAAGVLAIAIAFITVSYQALRAAMSNPVEAIKHE
jgi:putative ABC transport system permease protein